MAAGAVSLLAVLWLVRSVALAYVDLLWFESLGHASVFTTQLATSAKLFLGGLAISGCLLGANVWLVRRFAHDAHSTGGDDGLWTYLARVNAGLSKDARRARLGERAVAPAGAALSLAFGLWAASVWPLWLLAWNTVPFNMAEPFFGRDVGFYVFQLPLLRALHMIGFFLVATLLATALALYLIRAWFELRLPPRGALEELSRPGRLHLAGLAALVFMMLGLQHQLALAEVVFATSGQAFRLSFPGYVEANARVPALWGMSLAALMAVVLLARAAWKGPATDAGADLRSSGATFWRRVVAGPAVWLAALLVGSIYPAVVQALIVKPNEALLERPYLAQVIAMSRSAYGLDRLVERNVAAEEGVSPDLAQRNLQTLANTRLWEPEPLRLGLNQLQAFKPYYGFFLYPDLDRYTIDGQERAVFVAARELDPSALPARSWVNTRLQFTHGYGVVASAASAVGPDGRPVLIERDIPPVGPVGLLRPEIYFGERTVEPALVRTAEPEIDYPRGEENVRTHYQGAGGVSLGSPLARAAHALRLSDLNLLLSPAIQPETTLLYDRQIAERVQRIVPFLLLDADPYPVIADGRLIWLLDGYTTSDHFPLAPRTPARMLAADPRPGVTRNVQPNYLRGAVKATVDAYDGTINLYLIDPTDPVAAAYHRIYPGLFQSAESMPSSLRTHLRYPQQLFTVQSDALSRFHVEDPAQVYSGEDAWLVARGRLDSRPDARPMYAIQRLPGETEEEFALTIPYRPYSQANDRHSLVALLAAGSDPGQYGELKLYRYPRDRAVEGPFQAEQRIDQDPTVSAQFGLWQRSGAQLIRGDVQTVPLENSILYLESVYLQRAERTTLPELQRVVGVSGGRVVMEPTLEATLSTLFGTEINLAEAGSSASAAGRDRPSSARELAISAQEHLRRAQEALFAGDRARHEQELRAAQSDLKRLTESSR